MGFDGDFARTLFDTITSQWQLALPLAALLYLFPSLAEPLSFGAAGFILGSQFVLPSLRKLLLVLPFETPPMIENLDKAPVLWSLVAGVLTAAVLFGLYTSVIYLAAALLTFLAVHFVLSLLSVGGLSTIPGYGIIVVASIAGLVAGAYATRKRTVFTILLSVAVSSIVLSVLSTQVVSAFFVKLSDRGLFWSNLIFSVVLLFGRLTSLWGKR